MGAECKPRITENSDQRGLWLSHTAVPCQHIAMQQQCVMRLVRELEREIERDAGGARCVSGFMHLLTLIHDRCIIRDGVIPRPAGGRNPCAPHFLVAAQVGMGMNVMSGDQFAADPDAAMGSAGSGGGPSSGGTTGAKPPPKQPEPEPMSVEEQARPCHSSAAPPSPRKATHLW